MSENNNLNMETIAEAAVENTAPMQEAEVSENENAPAQETVKATGEKGGKKNKKKRKKARIALPIVAVLLVIALLFGTVVGYILGRNAVSERLLETERELAALTVAFEEASSAPAYDVFNEALTEENRTALSELAGVSYDDGVENILGEQDILGAVLEGGEETKPVVVAEFDGGTLMSDEVAREYEDQMASLLFAGYNEEDVAQTLLAEVMEYMVADRILQEKAKEMGLLELTAEDKAQIDQEAQQIYDSQLEFYRDYVNTEGMTEEEATGAVKSYMLENEGLSLDGIRTELESSWWVEKIYNEITKDVVPSDDDVQHGYEHLLEDQKASFEAYTDDYEYAQMSGETIVYNLDGYRGVRLMLFAFEDPAAYEAVLALSDELLELDSKKDAKKIAEYQAEIDSYYAAVEAEAQAVLDKIESGADFKELLISEGDDDGMKANAYLRESGYYVAEDSLLWPQEIISAAMALENEGDISEAVRVADGVCILQYVGEVPAGEVPLLDVKAQLKDVVLESAKYNAYEQQLDAWLQEANAVYYPERMQ